jgi:hypothetical protein
MPRRALDFYETPPSYIAALLGEVNVFGRVFEPCVGEGAIADALKKMSVVKSLDTNDLDEAREADYHFDATEPYPFSQDFDWCVTNPPFSRELEIIETAIDYGFPNMAFLARLSFLEPTEDREWFLTQHPPQQIIALPRYSFRPNDEGKKQTDSVTCCWLVWFADKTPRRFSAWSRGRAQAEATVRGL